VVKSEVHVQEESAVLAGYWFAMSVFF
jgi:hypothetical protein